MYVTVDVDIDLDEIETDELLDEITRRGFVVSKAGLLDPDAEF